MKTGLVDFLLRKAGEPGKMLQKFFRSEAAWSAARRRGRGRVSDHKTLLLHLICRRIFGWFGPLRNLHFGSNIIHS